MRRRSFLQGLVAGAAALVTGGLKGTEKPKPLDPQKVVGDFYDFDMNVSPIGKPIHVGLSDGGKEVSGRGYRRVETSSADWEVDGLSVINKTRIMFPEGDASWGHVDGFILADGDRNILMYGPLGHRMKIMWGDNIYFKPGHISIELS